MNLKEKITGVQHIGIPTNNIEQTISFYQGLGFEIAWQTINEKANEKVAFLQLGNLIIETYENRQAVMLAGAIDHIALDVTNIDSIFCHLKQGRYIFLNAEVQFLPFWEHGVKFFTIVGPNKEHIEFCERIKI